MLYISSLIFWKFHRKTLVLKSLFNRVFRIATLLKSVSNTGASCGICEIFKNIYFEESLRTTASETCSNLAFVSQFIKKRSHHRSFLVNSAKFLINTFFLKNPSDGCFSISTCSFYWPTTNFCFFKKPCHINFLAEYFLGLI